MVLASALYFPEPLKVRQRPPAPAPQSRSQAWTDPAKQQDFRWAKRLAAQLLMDTVGHESCSTGVSGRGCAYLEYETREDMICFPFFSPRVPLLCYFSPLLFLRVVTCPGA